VANGGGAPVVTSAGALIDGLQRIGAKKIAILTPYMKPLTAVVADYIEHEGFEVLDAVSLEIDDDLAVGARDPRAPIELSRRLNTANCDAVVLSACVQMPSLESIQPVQDRLGLPVLSAAVCTTYQMLRTLGLKAAVPDAGELLSGRY
jgi:maleate isomerase